MYKELKSYEAEMENHWKDTGGEKPGKELARAKALKPTAEMWYVFFKENGKVYRYLKVQIDDMELCFPAEERPALKMISEKALERLNQDSWNERTVSQPLPSR